MAFLHVARHLRHVDGIQRLLVRLAEVNAHLLHTGGDNQHVGADLPCQQRGGEILIYYRVDAAVVALLRAHDGNSSTARADHHKTFLRQRLDGICLYDAQRLWRGHDAAIAAA